MHRAEGSQLMPSVRKPFSYAALEEFSAFRKLTNCARITICAVGCQIHQGIAVKFDDENLADLFGLELGRLILDSCYWDLVIERYETEERRIQQKRAPR